MEKSGKCNQMLYKSSNLNRETEQTSDQLDINDTSGK